MPVDINGYALSTVASELKFGASNSRIAPATYGVRDPMLPAMTGSCTDRMSDGSGPYAVYPFPVNDVSQLNNGGVWSTSSFVFTAPVPGLYYTSYGGIVGAGDGSVASNGYFGVIVNGALWHWSYKNTQSVWELHHTELIVKLAAGDWVTWAMNVAPAPSTGTTCGAYRGNHNVCSIWLIG